MKNHSDCTLLKLYCPVGLPACWRRSRYLLRTHRFPFYSCCLLMVLSLWPMAASADTKTDMNKLTKLGIEELMEIEVPTVYGASRFEQKVIEAPSSVSIVTSDEIKKYGYRSLADILRSVRGFYATNDRNYNYLGVRGFIRPGDYNTRILILGDGHRINDNIYDTAPIGREFPLDVDLIDRIEVIRGPSSSLYGTSAFLAVINITTKTGETTKGTELSGTAGSQDTYAGRLSYGNRWQNGLDVLVSGSVYDSAGRGSLFYLEFADPSTNNGYAVNIDDEKAYHLYGKASLRNVMVTGVFSTRDKQIPTASYGTLFNDSRLRTTDDHGYLDIRYEHTTEEDMQVMARIFYDRYRYAGDYPYDMAGYGLPGQSAIDKDEGIGEWWGGEFQLTRSFFLKHKSTVGAEFRDNIQQDQKNYYDDPSILGVVPNPILDDQRNSKNRAIFFQDEYRILRNLILNVGVRYDHYDTFGGTTNPRLAFIYRPFAKSTLKFLYGEAFRAPNAYELYYNDGATGKPNPGLLPEEIRTYEIVYEQYLGEYLRSSLSGFSYRIENLISQQLDPTDNLMVYKNTEDFEVSGGEVELEGTWKNGLRSRISYTYQEARDVDRDETITNSPKHLAKFNLTIPLLQQKIFGSAEVQYLSDRKTLLNNTVGSFFLTNLTLFSKNILKGLELSASVYNLLDKKYHDSGAAEHLQDAIEQDGRTVRVKLTYSF